MKKRSGKVFAATLALLVCLNGMPLGTLAADESQSNPATAEWQVEDGFQFDDNQSEELIEEPSKDDQLKENQTADQAVDQPEELIEAPSEDEQSADVDQAEDSVDEQPAEEPTEEAQPTTTEDELPEKEPEQNQEQSESQQPQPNMVSENVEPASNLLAAPRVGETVYYVSKDGSDEAGDGTEGTPFATLAKAVEIAKDGDTICLLSDLTMYKMAYVGSKAITIDGQNHTVTRGDGFTRRNDQARGGYNPELIEVANGATLTLVNITLDDLNKKEGSVYEEQLTGEGDKHNEEKVQGAMIAAYGDGKGTIILGNGTTLKNFGGMSAVRIGGNVGSDGQWYGSTLIMESGSRIIDDEGMGADGRQGGFAAVWSQGGYVEMKAGSSISGIDGRAIYCEDGGTALINGEISNITSNETMEHFNYASNGGFGGIAIYSEAKASTIKLGETGTIHDIITKDNNSADVAVMLVASTFEMLPGSSIKDIDTIGLIDSNEGTMKIGGEVSNCHTNKVFFRMRGNAGTFELGENGIITNSSTTDAGIVYMNGGKPTITISGTMSDITAGEAIFISNNGSRQDGTCTVTETGVITKISGTAIMAGDPSKVSIYGEISNCGGYAVNYGNTTGSNVEIHEGSVIQGNNKGNAQIYIKTVTKADANDTNQHLSIAPDTLIGNQSVVTPFGTITLDEKYAAIGLGIASDAAFQRINNQVGSQDSTWKAVGKALWFKPSEDTLHFTVARPYTIPKGIGLHIGYIPLNADGTPADDAELTLLPLTNRETIDVTLTGLTAGQSYALAFVVENKYYVTIDAADITVYMGGEGNATVVDKDGNIYTEDTTLPEPGFKVDLPRGVTPDQVTIRTTDSQQTRSWKLEPYNGDEASDGVYKIVSTEGEHPRVQFTNANNQVVTSDEFKVGNAINQTLTMEIFKDEGTVVDAVVEGKDDVTYGVIANAGKLHVRGTTSKVQYGGLNKTLEAGKPGVTAKSDVTFTINDSDVPANQDAIALLFDNIIENTNSETNRTALLTKRADDKLSELGETVPAGMVRNYQFRYLDLVDTSNSNVWVDAKDENDNPAEVTVCWPYPEGTNKDTEFKLLHFEDLHRDMSANEVAGDIASCTVSPVIITKTDTHIEFTATEFSPFALVWNSTKPVEPEEGGESSGNGGTMTAPAATPAPTAQPAAQTQTIAAATTAVIPQTSDTSQPALWAGLLVFSGAVLTALYLLKRRKQNREQ